MPHTVPIPPLTWFEEEENSMLEHETEPTEWVGASNQTDKQQKKGFV